MISFVPSFAGRRTAGRCGGGRTARQRPDGAAAAGRILYRRGDRVWGCGGWQSRRRWRQSVGGRTRRVCSWDTTDQSLSESVWMMDEAIAADVGGLDNAWDSNDIT